MLSNVCSAGANRRVGRTSKPDALRAAMYAMYGGVSGPAVDASIDSDLSHFRGPQQMRPQQLLFRSNSLE
eukprot:1295305-Pyramimonas_sp.AAC.2